jgi:hypothetical protein
VPSGTVKRWISMRDWHLGQRGRAATGIRHRCFPLNQAGALPNSVSPMNAGTVR